MECTACGTADELVYACQRCHEVFCATHHDHRYHDCEPSDRSGGSETQRPTFRTRRTNKAPPVERPSAQVYPQEVDADDTAERTSPSATDRPGYGPERLTADPVGPADTIPEWFRRQTYLSLTVKVGLLATLCNLLAFSVLGAALVLPLS